MPDDEAMASIRSFSERSKKRSKLRGKTFPDVITERLGRDLKPVETVQLDVKADMAISEDLARELRDAPGLAAWYGLLKEHAHEAMKQARYNMHKRSERLYDQIKARSAKLTETAVKNQIHRDGKWLRHTERYMKWRYRYRVLSELCKAMDVRVDNIRTLEASKRKEKDRG